MPQTNLERDVLKTRIAERDVDVITRLQTPWHPERRPSTAVWTLGRTQLLWLRVYEGPTTAGGLEEAHNSVVQQLRRGALLRSGARLRR
jgi:hypothetical protein